jgi:hypothetical protein
MKKTAEKALRDIAYIKKIISDSERVVADKGTHYIMWGILVAFGQGLNYLFVELDDRNIIPDSFPYIIATWAVLFVAGGIFSLLHNRGKTRTKGSTTFAESIVGSVWLGVCLAMVIVIFLSLSAKVMNPFLIDPVVALFLGVAYFICSRLYVSRWMVVLAFGWWFGSIPMFLHPGKESFLVFGLMIVMFFIVPGIVFYLKHRDQ